MFSGTFFGLIAALYYLSFLAMVGLVLFIAWHGRRASRRARLRRTFYWLALSLLIWQLTLFLETHAALPAWQLWLGRANFASVVFTSTLSLRFVQQVAGGRVSRTSHLVGWLFIETWLLAAVTLLTPLVDGAETVVGEHPITTYGPLFPVYLLHVVGGLIAALVLALRQRRRAAHRAIRGQLTVIAAGMFFTLGIACVTNVLLPYGFGDFRFCDLGTLSTVFFLLAVTYAIFIHRLFSVRVLIRATLVYGILLAFVLGTYSSAIFVLTQYMTKHADQLTQFAVLLIAFSCDPLRRFLEKKVDRFLFHPERKKIARLTPARAGHPFLLALLFPWGRR
jgi:hypothetical protein